MIRRSFLQAAAGALSASVVGGCSHSAHRSPDKVPRARQIGAAGPAPIRAICFDLFTLFDPRSVVAVAESSVGPVAGALCELWRARQFQYAFLRAAAGQYRDFRSVTEDALIFAAQSSGLSLAEAVRERLVRAYSELAPWPDTRASLERLRAMGLRLAPLANYAPSMLGPLLENAGLTSSFDTLISTDAARTYKPHPSAYALGVTRLGLAREQIAFAAFGGWDAAGAKWFGYPTFWVNRLHVVREELAPAADATGATLAELEQFVAARNARGGRGG